MGQGKEDSASLSGAEKHDILTRKLSTPVGLEMCSAERIVLAIYGDVGVGNHQPDHADG